MDALNFNGLLGAGVLIGVFWAVIAWCRSLPYKILRLVIRYRGCTVDVRDNDQAYTWLNAWLGNHYAQKKAGIWSLFTRCVERDYQDYPHSNRERPNYSVHFTLAPGVHILRYNKKFFMISKSRRDLETGAGGRTYEDSFEILTSPSGKDELAKIIEEGRILVEGKKVNVLKIHRHDGDGYWEHDQQRDERPISSVHLADGIAEKVLDDLTEFHDSRDWYAELGIPYRRSYLLHGPPGSGKTSFAVAIASHLHRSLYVIDLANPGLKDSTLLSTLAGVPRNGVVLFEDVDCCVPDRKKEKDQRVTLSGLLNALDGVASPEGHVRIFTTNHPERLDPALTRPGRMDLSIYIGHATEHQASRLFERFYRTKDGAEQFAAAAMERHPISMATLQGHLLQHRKDPHEAIRSLAHGKEDRDTNRRIRLEAKS